MNDAARLIIASGGQCCANCLYGEDPPHPNPFRPAVACHWLASFPRLPSSMVSSIYMGGVEMAPETTGCPAWEKKGK